MIYGQMKGVLAARRLVREQDGWKEGWTDGETDGGMARMMAACHGSRQCFDSKSSAMASPLSCFCLFCHLLVWVEWGQLSRSRALSNTHTHRSTDRHTNTVTQKCQQVAEEADHRYTHTNRSEVTG